MPYECAFGCKKYNNLCDACDAMIYDEDNPYETELESRKIFWRAVHGANVNGEDDNDISWVGFK